MAPSTMEADSNVLWQAAGPPQYSAADLTSTPQSKHTFMIGLVGLMCIVALALIYCKFFYKYCTACDVGRLPRSGSRADYLRRTLAGTTGGADGDGDGGLAYRFIRLLPTCEFCKLGSFDENITSCSKDCSICLSPFEDHDKVRLLPACRHPFHLPCIDTWLLSHATCPICRCGVFPLAKKCCLQVPAPPRVFPLVPANPIRVDIDIICI